MAIKTKQDNPLVDCRVIRAIRFFETPGGPVKVLQPGKKNVQLENVFAQEMQSAGKLEIVTGKTVKVTGNSGKTIDPVS